MKKKIKTDDVLANEKNKLIKPSTLIRFYSYLIPSYFLNTNILFLFKFRKDFSPSKYFILFAFNLLSVYIFFLHVDKVVFEEYVSKPNPYSKYMREEFLKHMDEISQSSYSKILRINNEIIKKYKF